MTFKRQIIRAILLLLVAALPCLATTDHATVRTVVVGYYPAPGLMNGADDNATKSGYAYDYIQEVANHAGWQYHYVYGSFRELYQKLLTGEIDILPYVTWTAERADEILFPSMQMGEERLYIASMKPEPLDDALSEIHGRKVGLIRGAFPNEPFIKLLKEKGVSCEFVEFHLADERSAALTRGEVDFIVETSTEEQNIPLCAVYEFGDKYPFYLAVSKDRSDLLQELNSAQKYIDDVNPGFLNTLKLKYFKGIPLFKAIPAEGMAWLESHSVIRIGAYNQDSPYVIKNADGSVSGIGPDYVSFMLKSLNLSIPVEWKVYDGRESALKALREEEIDLINPYYCSYGDAESDGVAISAAAFNSSFSVLYQGGYSSETMALIATPYTRIGAMYVRDNYPNAKVVPCLNGYDCIDKLLDGQANCVVMHTYALNEIASKYNEDFHIKPLNAPCPVCFAALPKNVALLSAIDKAVPFLTDVELNAILDKNSIEEKTGVTPGQFFRHHPEYILLGLGVLLTAAIVIIVLKVRSARRQRESLTFANYFIEKFDSTYYVNLKTGAFKVFRRSSELERDYPVIPDYLKSMKRYIANVVHPEDRETLGDFIQPENLRNRLREKPMDSIVFRRLKGNDEKIYRLWIVRGEDENSAAFAFANVTDEVKAEERNRNALAEFAKVREEQRRTDTLHSIIHSGKWSFFLNSKDEIVDARYSDAVKKIIDNDLHDGNGYDWSTIVHPDDRKNALAAFNATIADHSGKTPYDVTYRMKDRHGKYHWFHSAGRIIRQQDGSGEFFGVHIDITDQFEAQLEQQRLLEAALATAKETNLRLDESNRHEKLKGDAFGFMLNNDNLEAFVDFFSKRILELYGCDQVIYRDIEGRQILKERPGTKPLDFSLCATCPHFAFDAPVYEDGFTAMDDCTVGYKGIPVHPNCRVRASLTYLVHEDGKVFGYIALHYLDGTHQFSDEEKNTFDQLAKFMSMVLSRRKQQEALKKSLAFSNYFLNTFISTYYVNLKTRECTPYSLSEKQGKDYSVIPDYLEAMRPFIEENTHPDDRAGYWEFIQPENLKALLKEKPMITYRVRDISMGTERIIGIQGVRGSDENNVAIAFSDLTEETKKEQERQEQRRLKSFGEMVNAATWSMEIKGRDEIFAVHWSDELRHAFGFQDKSDFPDTMEAWTDRLHPEDKGRVLDSCLSGIRSNQEDTIYNVEYRFKRKSGKYCWYQAYGRIENKSGDFRTYYGIVIDISLKKALEIRNARFEIVKDLIKAGLWNFKINAADEVVDAEYSGDIVPFLNVDEALRKEGPNVWVRLVHPDDREAAFTAFNAAISDHTCKTPYDVNYRMLDKDGNYNWFRSAGSVLRHDDGTGDFFGIQINMTKTIEKEREQQRQLEEALEAAESANKAKTEFLFNMSHDIRTPMNAILGFTGMAEKHLDDRTKVRDCLAKAQQSGNLLLSLINSILDMSRIEAGSAELQENPGNVLLSFINIENALQEIAATRDVRLTFEFGEITDQFVYADFQRCIRIFTNLIANAIKYSHEGGYVKVRCEQITQVKDGYAYYRYTIEDNGIGMSEEFQKHMFENFAREHNSTTSGIPGTGLGLSVCKTFVDYLNGTIECASKLGEGTTFTVTLPFRIQSGRQYTDLVTGEVVTDEAKVKKNDAHLNLKGKKVLIVEDNELNREIAVEILEEEGLSIEEAADGSIAVQTLKEKGPNYFDFILMDIQMPVMNGYEATKAIRAMYPNARIPIIAVSANAFEEDKKASREAGMDDHVAKPVRVKDLLVALSKFV